MANQSFMASARRGMRLVLVIAFWSALWGTGAFSQDAAQKKQAEAIEAAALASDDITVHPLQVSASGRYFVDQRGVPIFWLGTTQWELFRGYSLDDAKTIIVKTKERGFAFIQVMLMGVGDGTRPNFYGEKAWIDDDPLKPNEAYFRNVDAVVQSAQEQNLAISMTVFHQKYRKYITVANARAWGKWIAERYNAVPGIIWSMTPVAEPQSIPLLRNLIEGLREGDGGAHLITAKPDPSPHSSSFMHSENLLNFNSMQTWSQIELIYPMVTRDYQLKPATPVLMAEGAYEAGTEYGFDVTPLWIRRQAYYSYLVGGHHAYGHNDSWRVLPTWKSALDAPGAQQFGILKKIFLGREEWWQLVPDQTVLVAGGNTNGRVLTLAARHEGGKWIMVYWGGKEARSIYQRIMNRLSDLLGVRSSVSVRTDRLRASSAVNAFWIDPRTGASVSAGRFASGGEQTFQVPLGWEDAVLILEDGDG